MSERLDSISSSFETDYRIGEALGAIGSLTSLPILEKFANDSNPEISTTCQLAVERIKWAKEKGENRVSPFNSVGEISALKLTC